MKKKTVFKFVIVFVLLLALLSGAIQVTISYLTANDKLKNTFVTGNTDIFVTEVFDAENGIKSDVAVKNEGNVPVYVRVAVKIYWEDTNGNVVLDSPVKETDYSISVKENTKWFLGSDGFYYYSVPLGYNEGFNQTDVLIESCKQIKTYSDGRVLVVDIVSQSIQSTPAIAVENAWGVEVNDNGVLVLKEVV